MVEILPGTLAFIQLPDNHIIKRFCRKHKITEFTIQEDLMKLINECNFLFLKELMQENNSQSPQEIFEENINKRAEEL